MSSPAGSEPGLRQRLMARSAVLLAAVAAALLLGVALHQDLWMLAVVAVGLAVVVASTYTFLARRAPLRWLALGLVVATPPAIAWLFVESGLMLVLLLVLTALGLAFVTGRAALMVGATTEAMPEHPAPAPRHPFILMNPRSGGGKVERFGLKEKAEALGAEVVVLGEPGTGDVAALARDAVARGADLLGVAGGDGTQALVAAVAAERDIPFMVISAGTRNHFALDLGLDRDDPTTCLDALTDDAVEVHVDLGSVSGRTFVNNASFGAYATVVQSPAYRDDKTRTTLELLPDVLTGHSGPRLIAHADGVTVRHPQAVLVSDNPYGTGDVAGMGRRTRVDAGVLGVVAVTVDNARQAVGLLRRTSNRGLTVLEVPEVVVTADAPEIPVGVDGEALMLPTPVRCTIRPKALRVRLPRHRPGVPPRRVRWDWAAVLRLASFGGTEATA